MPKENGLTLKEIQLILNTAQHVLIHLCEKKVINPDILEGKGRGKYRLFSHRNLFEFAVALELRKYEIPVKIIGIITRVLAHFENATKELTKGEFSIPESFSHHKTIPVTLYLFDGNILTLSIGSSKSSRIPAIHISPYIRGNLRKVSLQWLPHLPKDFSSCLELNLSQIASRLPKPSSS